METISETEHTARRIEPIMVSESKANELKEQVNKALNQSKGKPEREFRAGWKWNSMFKKSNKPRMEDQALVLYFTKKNDILMSFMPIYDGNMIVYKNKVYHYNPRHLWTIRLKGRPKVYCLREGDRRPIRNKNTNELICYAGSTVSHDDLDDVKARGEATDADELLAKFLLRIKVAEIKGKMKNAAIWVLLGIAVLGVLGWVFLSKSGGAAAAGAGG